jgi:transcriptional regulator with PAS, ATPase and Fis domain
LKIDVRVTASGERGLSSDGVIGTREDLFYRLNAMHLVVPMHRLDDSLYRQWLSVR